MYPVGGMNNPNRETTDSSFFVENISCKPFIAALLQTPFYAVYYFLPHVATWSYWLRGPYGSAMLMMVVGRRPNPVQRRHEKGNDFTTESTIITWNIRIWSSKVNNLRSPEIVRDGGGWLACAACHRWSTTKKLVLEQKYCRKTRYSETAIIAWEKISGVRSPGDNPGPNTEWVKVNVYFGKDAPAGYQRAQWMNGDVLSLTLCKFCQEDSTTFYWPPRAQASIERTCRLRANNNSKLQQWWASAWWNILFCELALFVHEHLSIDWRAVRGMVFLVGLEVFKRLTRVVSTFEVSLATALRQSLYFDK